MKLLAIDTALGACQAVVTDGEAVLAVRSELMHRGQQERLGPMVAELMREANLGFGDLDRIGVTAGPGSFTGLRVGLAFAKGLALARALPCVGVGALDALAATADAGRLLEAFAFAARLVLVGSGAPLVAAFRPEAEVLPLAAPDPVALARLAAAAPEGEGPPRPIYLRAPDARLPS